MVDENIDELFDVVDGNNRVIGRERRSVVHSKGLWHRGVYVFLLNGKGEIFMQKRAETKDLYPGLWDLSAGEHMKPGESYEDAAKRGVEEELGVEAVDVKKIGELRWTFEGSGKRDNEFNELFTSRFRGRIRLDEEEIQEGRWVGKERLLEEMKKTPERFTPWTARCLALLGRNG